MCLKCGSCLKFDEGHAIAYTQEELEVTVDMYVPTVRKLQ